MLNNDGDLTAPSWLAWDAQGERLALGYDSFVAILGSNPVLALKTSVPMRGSTGGVWNGAELCVCGSDGISVLHLSQEGYDAILIHTHTHKHTHACTCARIRFSIQVVTLAHSRICAKCILGCGVYRSLAVRTLATTVDTPTSIHGASIIPVSDVPRPIGRMEVIGIHSNRLWLADAAHHFHSLSLHPTGPILGASTNRL